jgi:hypothetical protein
MVRDALKTPTEDNTQIQKENFHDNAVVCIIQEVKISRPQRNTPPPLPLEFFNTHNERTARDVITAHKISTRF